MKEPWYSVNKKTSGLMKRILLCVGVVASLCTAPGPCSGAFGTLPRVPTTCAPRVRLPRMSLLEPAELTPPPEAVVAAVEATYERLPSGSRLTAADLAAQAGISIDDARRGMKELATALAGADGLSVSASERGDLLYVFPAECRRELASRSNAAKARGKSFRLRAIFGWDGFDVVCYSYV